MAVFLFHLALLITHYARRFCGCSDVDALDLIRKLLAFNPGKRITADEALDHRFVEDEACGHTDSTLPCHARKAIANAASAIPALFDLLIGP